MQQHDLPPVLDFNEIEAAARRARAHAFRDLFVAGWRALGRSLHVSGASGTRNA